MYISSRSDLFLVFLQLYWIFLCQVITWSLMPLKFSLAIMVAIPISALLVRIQGCSLCKDKQTNGEVRGSVFVDQLDSLHAWYQRDAAKALLGCEKTVIEFRKAILWNSA